jgi:oligopeptide/dipeptide ABC transporter ATP-binding protein
MLAANHPDPVLEVERLSVRLTVDGRNVPVTHDIGFSIAPGETLALVGESGSGKSVTALAMLRLLGRGLSIAPGSRIAFQSSRGAIDIASLSDNDRRVRAVRGAEIGMIFQEPMSSFSPIHTIGSQIAEVVQVHENIGHAAARERAVEFLGRAGIADPSGAFDRYPQEFSGGMRQRAMIAKALVCRPRLLVADEPTTALDVSIQAQILALLDTLRRDLGMAVLFITHDLGIVAHLADKVAIMYAGHIVERGDVRAVFRAPSHPYTRGLLAAVPRLGDLDRHRRLAAISGSVPSIFDPPAGCPFHPRCSEAVRGVCSAAYPASVRVAADGNHVVDCVHAYPAAA